MPLGLYQSTLGTSELTVHSFGPPGWAHTSWGHPRAFLLLSNLTFITDGWGKKKKNNEKEKGSNSFLPHWDSTTLPKPHVGIPVFSKHILLRQPCGLGWDLEETLRFSQVRL